MAVLTTINRKAMPDEDRQSDGDGHFKSGWNKPDAKTLRPEWPGLKSNLINLIRLINCRSMANSRPVKADLGGLKIACQALMKSLQTTA